METKGLIHLSPDGPRPCGAEKGGCPYAAAGEPHFDNMEDANAAYQQRMEARYGSLPESLKAVEKAEIPPAPMPFATSPATEEQVSEVALLRQEIAQMRAEMNRPASTRFVAKLSGKLSELTQAWKEGWEESKEEGEFHRATVRHARQERIHKIEQEFAAAAMARRLRNAKTEEQKEAVKKQINAQKDKSKEDKISERKYGREREVAHAGQIQPGDYILPGVRVTRVGLAPEGSKKPYLLTFVNEKTGQVASSDYDNITPMIIQRPNKREMRGGQHTWATRVQDSPIFRTLREAAGLERSEYQTMQGLDLERYTRRRTKAPLRRRLNAALTSFNAPAPAFPNATDPLEPIPGSF